jgi:hypothetical protein
MADNVRTAHDYADEIPFPANGMPDYSDKALRLTPFAERPLHLSTTWLARLLRQQVHHVIHGDDDRSVRLAVWLVALAHELVGVWRSLIADDALLGGVVRLVCASRTDDERRGRARLGDARNAVPA